MAADIIIWKPRYNHTRQTYCIVIIAQSVQGRKWLQRNFVDSPASLNVDSREEANRLIDDYIGDIGLADLTVEIS